MSPHQRLCSAHPQDHPGPSCAQYLVALFPHLMASSPRVGCMSTSATPGLAQPRAYMLRRVCRAEMKPQGPPSSDSL